MPNETGDRLDSWKDIAAYLVRDVSTVRRWEKREGMPVHRHVHAKLGSVYAYRSELDAWWRGRDLQQESPPSPSPSPTPWRGMRVDLAGLLCLLATAAYLLPLSRTSESDRIEADATVDSAAHQEYLIGRYHLWREDEQNLSRAIVHFERAAAIDPDYAVAYAGLSQAWWSLGMWGSGLAEAEEPSRTAARKALELDDRLAEASVVEADLKRLYDWDWTGAEKAVRHALELDPRSVAAHHTYALLLHQIGRFPEAIAHIERAEALDSLSPAIQSTFGRILYRAGQFDEAVPRLLRALELEPGMSRVIYSRLGDAYEQMGRYDLALAAVEKAGLRSPHHVIARIYARMGRHRDARQMLLRIASSGKGLPAQSVAGAYAALGDDDEAFRLLFGMAAGRRASANFVKVDPRSRACVPTRGGRSCSDG